MWYHKSVTQAHEPTMHHRPDYESNTRSAICVFWAKRAEPVTRLRLRKWLKNLRTFLAKKGKG